MQHQYSISCSYFSRLIMSRCDIDLCIYVKVLPCYAFAGSHPSSICRQGKHFHWPALLATDWLCINSAASHKYLSNIERWTTDRWSIDSSIWLSPDQCMQRRYGPIRPDIGQWKSCGTFVRPSSGRQWKVNGAIRTRCRQNRMYWIITLYGLAIRIDVLGGLPI